MDIEEIAGAAVDCGCRVHKELGPGLLESVYEVVLAKMLTERGLRIERQKQIPNYLRPLDLPLGLLMNFGAPTQKRCQTRSQQ